MRAENESLSDELNRSAQEKEYIIAEYEKQLRLLKGENSDAYASRTEWERKLRAAQEEIEDYKRQLRDKENEKNFFENELKKSKSFQLALEGDKNKFVGTFGQLQDENGMLSNEIVNLRDLNDQLQAKYDQAMLDNAQNEENIQGKFAEFDNIYNNIVSQLESEHNTCESLKVLLQSRNDEYAAKESGLIQLMNYFFNGLFNRLSGSNKIEDDRN